MGQRKIPMSNEACKKIIKADNDGNINKESEARPTFLQPLPVTSAADVCGAGDAKWQLPALRRTKAGTRAFECPRT